MEYVTGYEAQISSLWMFYDGLILILTTSLFLTVSKNTFILLKIGLALNIFQFVLMSVFHLPESVKYLLSRGKYKEASEELDYVLYINRPTPEEKEII